MLIWRQMYKCCLKVPYELIVKLDQSLYRIYIWKSKSVKPMLYVKLLKALYRTLQAALLFWKLLSDTLEWGFKLNEYDKCIANKTINRRQCTIIWHVDDLKIYHVDKNVEEDVISKLNERFGEESPLVTSHGKVLEYLRMCIDYTTKGKVKIGKYKYIEKT